MRLAPASRVTTRTYSVASRWEGIILYFTAYLCTLIAVFAAQLSLDTSFTVVVGAVTIVGLPLSLWLRWSNLRVGQYRIPRQMVNSIVVVISIAASLCYLMLTNPALFTGRLYQTLMVDQNAGEAIKLLMKTFLILAACRSLAIITDKDAVLCTVPSFSVLLLLIVVHRGPEVVAYFLLWSIVAAVLFALDHRSEARDKVIGFVPSIVPGQDVPLSARGLASVMGLSLAFAVTLSFILTARNPSERGALDTWMITMASRFTQKALQLPEVSANNGPEQQIDFGSNPLLPSRTPLWQVRAYVNYMDGRQVNLRPQYWRLFTLGRYDGSSWTQARGTLTEIDPQLRRRNSRRILNFNIREQMPTTWAKSSSSFGTTTNRITVIQQIRPAGAVTGFIPSLPTAVEAATQVDYFENPMGGFEQLRRPNETEYRANWAGRTHLSFRQDDHALKVGVLQPSQRVFIRSEVPPSRDYGTPVSGSQMTPPQRRPSAGLNQDVNPEAQLSTEERQRYLELPHQLRLPSSSVPRLVKKVLLKSGPDESNYRRAQRLVSELQQDAVYTLRPPAIPEGRDATEFFLETRRGYCTFYAGALAVLCRSAGIPARVVSGFAVFGDENEVAENEDWVTLREANAHAWTEVWVEGWGWTLMDATPGDNRGNNTAAWWESWTELFSVSLDDVKSWLLPHIKWAFLVVPLLIIGAFLLFGRRIAWVRKLNIWGRCSSYFRLLLGRAGGPKLQAWLARSENENVVRRDIAKIYDRAALTLARKFRLRGPAETPHEWFLAAQQSLDLRDPAPLQKITDLYVQAVYSPLPIKPQAVAEAREAMRVISWKRVPKPKVRRSFLPWRKPAAQAN